MIYEKNGFFVQQDQSGNWTVFRPSKSGTHSERDSAYPAGIDGLSLAICRAVYLADAGQKIDTWETLRWATDLATDYLAKGKAMARNRRAALAAFEAEFMAQG